MHGTVKHDSSEGFHLNHAPVETRMLPVQEGIEEVAPGMTEPGCKIGKLQGMFNYNFTRQHRMASRLEQAETKVRVLPEIQPVPPVEESIIISAEALKHRAPHKQIAGDK
jgi:hypothetical protein